MGSGPVYPPVSAAAERTRKPCKGAPVPTCTALSAHASLSQMGAVHLTAHAAPYYRCTQTCRALPSNAGTQEGTGESPAALKINLTLRRRAAALLAPAGPTSPPC